MAAIIKKLYLAGLGPPEAQVIRPIGRYCIVTGLGLTTDRLGGQVAQAWQAFSKVWLYHYIICPPPPYSSCEKGTPAHCRQQSLQEILFTYQLGCHDRVVTRDSGTCVLEQDP